MEAAQRGLVQPQEVPHVFCYPLPVAKEFGLLPQPQRFTQMTLSEGGETVRKHVHRSAGLTLTVVMGAKATLADM